MTAIAPILERPEFFQVRQNPSTGKWTELFINTHEGQLAALQSRAAIILACAGTGGGKTSVLVEWLRLEIERCGAGDYLVVSVTFTLAEGRLIPEIIKVFETILGFGHYTASPRRKFVFTPEGCRKMWGEKWDGRTPCVIYFAHGDDPNSCESFHCKAAALDEPGQPEFRLESFEAIQRRLRTFQAYGMGRIFMGTTPYDMGWLVTQIMFRAHKVQSWTRGMFGKWRCHRTTRGGDDINRDIEVVRWPSDMNPCYSPEVLAKAKAELPPWKFKMFHEGEPTTPAGLVYDCFDQIEHIVPDFTPSDGSKLTLGLDFGGINTAGILFSTVGRRTAVYQEYVGAETRPWRTAAQHVQSIMKMEPRGFDRCVGGARSEGEWRYQFGKAGMRVSAPPVRDLEIQIQRVYGAFKAGRLVICKGCVRTLDMLSHYMRECDSKGNPIEEIRNKEAYHLLDALRYGYADIHQSDAVNPWTQANLDRALATNEMLPLEEIPVEEMAE